VEEGDLGESVNLYNFWFFHGLESFKVFFIWYWCCIYLYVLGICWDVEADVVNVITAVEAGGTRICKWGGVFEGNLDLMGVVYDCVIGLTSDKGIGFVGTEIGFDGGEEI